MRKRRECSKTHGTEKAGKYNSLSCLKCISVSINSTSWRAKAASIRRRPVRVHIPSFSYRRLKHRKAELKRFYNCLPSTVAPGRYLIDGMDRGAEDPRRALFCTWCTHHETDGLTDVMVTCGLILSLRHHRKELRNRIAKGPTEAEYHQMKFDST